MKELEDNKAIYFPDKKRGVTFALSSDVEEVTLRPLIKIETIGDSQGQQTAIKTACTPTELPARPQAAFLVLLHKHRGWQQWQGQELQDRSKPAGFNLQRGGGGEGAGPEQQQLWHIMAPAATTEGPTSPPRSYQGHRKAVFSPAIGFQDLQEVFLLAKAGKVKVCVPAKHFTKIKDGK